MGKVKFYVGFFEEVEAELLRIEKYSNGENKYIVGNNIHGVVSVPEHSVLEEYKIK